MRYALKAFARFFAGTGSALSTPSGVDTALLPTYCPADREERLEFAGGMLPSCRLP